MAIRSVQAVIVALVASAFLVSDVGAQRRRGIVDVSPSHERRGFWLEGGLGAGTESFKFDDEQSYTDGLTKPTFSLGLGGTVSPSLRLGVEATIWVYNYFDDVELVDVTETLTGVLATARFYPARTAGFFVKGGGGLGVSAADIEFGEGTSETGFAWLIGAGYEIRVSRGLFITPSIEYSRHSFQQRDAPTLQERLLNLGVRLTWQPGR